MTKNAVMTKEFLEVMDLPPESGTLEGWHRSNDDGSEPQPYFIWCLRAAEKAAANGGE